MSAPALRPAVARCLELAAWHAAGGDPERARGLLGMALDLAVSEEVPVVVAAVDRLLSGASTRPPPPPPLSAVELPPSSWGPPATAVKAPPPKPAAPLRPPAVAPAPAPAPVATAVPPAAAPRQHGSARRHVVPLLAATLLGAAAWGGIGLIQRPPPPQPAEARALLRRGQVLLSRGDTAAALPALREAARAVDRSPDSPAATARRLLDRVD